MSFSHFFGLLPVPSAQPLNDMAASLFKNNHEKDKKEKNKDVPGVFGTLVYLYAQKPLLEKYGTVLADAAKNILATWDPTILQIKKVLAEISQELKKMEAPKKDEKNSVTLNSEWQKFTAELSKSINAYEEFSKSLKNEPLNSIEIIKKAIALIESLSNLLTKFNELNLNARVNTYIPESLAGLTQTIFATFSKMVADILPKNLQINIGDYLKKSDFLSEKNVSSLPQWERILVLFLLELSNKFLGNLTLTVHDFENNNSIKEGHILNRPMGFLSNKSINDFIKELGDTYQNLMRTNHYSPAESFPYKESLEEKKRIAAAGQAKEKEPKVLQISPSPDIDIKIKKDEKISHSDLMGAFSKFISTMQKNMEEMRNLVKQKDSQKEEVTPKRETIKTIKADLEKVEDGLKKTLDDKAYQTFFVASNDNKDQKTWIQDLGNHFINTKKNIALLEKYFSDKDQSKRENRYLLNDIKDAIDDTETIAENVKNLFLSLAAIKENPFGKQFFTAPNLPKFISSLTKQDNCPVNSEKHSNSGLDQLKNRINAIYDFLAKNETKKEEPIVGFSQLIRDKFLLLNNDIEEMKKDPSKELGPWDYLKFLFRNRDTFKLILNDALYLLKHARDLSLEIIRQFNLFLRDLYLIIDKIEIQLYLKENYLKDFAPFEGFSFKTLIQSFNKQINDLGYEFHPEEQFPYRSILSKQRKEMLEKEKSPFGKEFIKSRITRELHDHYKIDLEDNPPKKEGVKKESLINKILLKIESLKKQREERYYYFEASRRAHLESVIHALNRLYVSVKKPGFTIDEALNKMKFNNQDGIYHLILSKYEGEFLKELKEIDKNISKEERGKKLIGKLAKQKNCPVIEKQEANNNIDNKHSNATVSNKDKMNVILIKRTRELENYFIGTTTKQSKIWLLTELSKLLKTESLKKSLNSLRKLRPDIFYLLHEGKTGKMIKSLEYLTLSKDDMLSRIKLEISRLQEKRTEKLYFFAKSRKITLEKRIQALYALQNASRKQEITEAFNSLSTEEKNILRTHEAPLLNDMELWRKLHVMKSRDEPYFTHVTQLSS